MNVGSHQCLCALGIHSCFGTESGLLLVLLLTLKLHRVPDLEAFPVLSCGFVIAATSSLAAAAAAAAPGVVVVLWYWYP